MSIIDEALKKTQQNLDQKNQNPDDKNITDIYEKLHKTTDKKPGPPISQPEPKKNNPLVGIFVLLLFIAAGYYGYTYVTSGKNKNVTAAINKVKTTVANTTKQEKPAAPAVVKPKVYGENELVLNGIMSSPTQQSVLINDRIYEVGDEIKGKVVTAIGEDYVELTDEAGLTSKLTTRH